MPQFLYFNTAPTILDMVNGLVISTAGLDMRKVPAGVTSLNIEIWGGGGSGSQADTATIIGSGGGSGAYCERLTKTVVPGSIINFTIGLGGISADATNGSSTTCDSMTAGGGVAGNEGIGTQIGGAGGTPSGGDINTNGSVGGTTTVVTAGNGGNAPNGGTGGAGGNSTTGSPGSTPGAGGGGANGGSHLGGNGANGGIRFSW